MTRTDAQARCRSHAEEMFARDLTAHRLGLRIVEVAPGQASLRMPVTDWMVNGHGVVHGGCLFLLADAAFAYASNSHGPVVLAQSAQITFLRPVAAGQELAADAVQRSRVGRIGVYDVTVRQADGAVVAEFRGQSVALSGPPVPRPGRPLPDPEDA